MVTVRLPAVEVSGSVPLTTPFSGLSVSPAGSGVEVSTA